jgi:hypothetical protein
LGDDGGIVRAGVRLDRLYAFRTAITRKEAKRPLPKRVRLCKVNTWRRAHLVRPIIAGDTGYRRRNRYGSRQLFGKPHAAEPPWSNKAPLLPAGVDRAIGH